MTLKNLITPSLLALTLSLAACGNAGTDTKTATNNEVAQLEAKRLMVRSYSSLHLHSEKFPQAVEVGVTATFKKNQV